MIRIKIDGKQVYFVRADGSFAENSVGEAGIDSKTGEVLFYEIMGSVKPELNGQKLYKRIIIRRVFPVIMEGDDADVTKKKKERKEK